MYTELFSSCCAEPGIPLESNPGNQLSSCIDLWYMEHFLVAEVTSGSL